MKYKVIPGDLVSPNQPRRWYRDRENAERDRILGVPLHVLPYSISTGRLFTEWALVLDVEPEFNEFGEIAP